jgi:hypothetical protein
MNPMPEKMKNHPPNLRQGPADFTKNDWEVLKALCQHPWMNDRELFENIGIKMSTITSIKNRLRASEVFRKANIPAYHRLGYTLLSASMIRMDLGDADVQGGVLPGTAAVFSVRDPLGCFVLALHKGYEDYRTFTDRLDRIAGNRSDRHCGPWHHHIYVLRDGERVVEFDFTNAVSTASRSNGLDRHPAVRLDGEPYEVRRKVVRKALSTLIAMPEAMAISLVGPIGLTRQSITKTMHMLRRKGILGRSALVDLRAIGMELVAVTRLRFAGDGQKGRQASGKAFSDIERIMRPFWYFVFGEDHILLSCHANYDTFVGTMTEIRKIKGVSGLRTHVFGMRGGNMGYGFGVE